MDEPSSAHLSTDGGTPQAGSSGARYIRFGPFEVDLHKGELRKNGIRVKLKGKPFQVLAILLEHPGEVVSRDTLRQRLWAADTYVDFDGNVNTVLNKLRQVLGDAADQTIFIRTIPRRGYSFIAAVEVLKTPTDSRDANPEILGSNATQLPEVRSRFWGRRATIVLASVCIASIGLLAVWLVWPKPWTISYAPTKPPGHRTLLILPFENLSGDATQEYVSDGLTDEMITTLGGLQPSRLSVIARASAMAYKKGHRTVRQMAAETGADALLTGGVYRSKNRVRITAQLIDARSQTNLWTETYDRETADLLVLQREVALQIARALSLELLPSQPALARSVAKNAEAYDFYLRGLYNWNRRGADDLKRAAAYFEQAIEKDPSYAPAYVGAAQTYLVSIAWMAASPEEGYAKARAAAEKALSIDPNLSGAHAALAGIYHENDRDSNRAENSFRRALELNPADASAHQWYAEFLTAVGRHNEAIEQMMRARQLDPLSLIISADLANILNYARRYDEAIEVCRKVLEADPNFVPAHEFLARAYFLKGKYAEGVSEQQKIMRLKGAPPTLAAEYGKAFERGGIEEARRWRLATNLRTCSSKVAASYGRAVLYAELGEREQALESLEQAARRRASGIEFVAVDPRLDSLRGVPRFQNLLHGLGYVSN